ncbi:hypothetical protein ACKWTF_008340 [Chironomus riparius]
MMEKASFDCCILCKTKTLDELNYGELYSDENIAAHLFCMLFGPGLLQNGSDNEGFEGFLQEDIRTEARRVQPLKCRFCKQRGANLGCTIQTCRAAYHTKCAIENNIVFEFTSKYRTYCNKHKKIKQIDNKKLDSECGMCYDSLIKKFPDAVLSPCCRNSWFHKKCMQKYALSSALLFKCPLCGSKKTEEWMKLGIFFPIRDAAWELEENAYQEFYEPIKLSCEDMKCKNKCLHAGEMHMWRLCQFCGAAGIHEQCFQGSPNDKYTCKGCEDVFNRPKSDTASESEGDEDTESNKSIETDQVQQDKLDNNDDNEKPKSYAATIFGESDVSSDDEVWKQCPQKINNMKHIKSKKKRHKVMYSDSDLSDEENQPPSKKVKSKYKKKEQLKQQSIANILLGESDASDDSDFDCTLIIL